MLEPWLVLKEIRRWNKGSDVLKVRFVQLMLKLVREKGLRNDLLLPSNNKSKFIQM